jgi:hypothetical protein
MKKLLQKSVKSTNQFISSILNWAKKPEGISTLILILTLFFLILTFQYTNRPYVGVFAVDSNYNKESKDLVSNIQIRNTGNIPANNVQTNLQMIYNSIVLEEMIGTSRFVLFPGQETSGFPTFHNVTKINLENDKIDIRIEIKYELPIRFIFKFYTRKFLTIELLRFDIRSGKFQIISGESQ